MATIKKSTKASPMVDQDRQWKVSSAMDTLLRYNDLLKDKGLMKDVQKKAQDQLGTVNSTLKMGGSIKKYAPKKVVKKAVKKK
jgi:hypothetical protein